MPSLKSYRWLLLLALAITVLVYTPGLNGPFLFDDHIHITQNKWVKIDGLDWQSLRQAWNSSFSSFPSNRPLAQLSFGINHALSGLDPWGFKVTNLLIHLLTGLFVFVFVRLAYRAVAGAAADPRQEALLGIAVTALWLLHPLHVSSVLYTVQRMTLLSSLSMLIGLCCYLHGRLRIAAGRPGIIWMLAAAPIALVGFLGKENAVLLPLLLLVAELTLLRQVSKGDRPGTIHLVWIAFIALPLLAGLGYVISHPELMNHAGRPFTLEERVLTQPRILWHYLSWLFIPDISAFGLFHDDIPISTGLFSPPTTIVAIVALAGLALASLLLSRRVPVFAFAVLFFLANHALESSVLPLEMVFEHRNYLASLGPLLLLGYLITIASARIKVHSLAMLLGGLLLLSYSVVTYIRVDNWSSYKSFMLSSAENHPLSPRSNFMAAQMLISAMTESPQEAPVLGDAAEIFLRNGLAVDARCINCLFGLIVLDMHRERPPERAVVTRLAEALRSGFVGPTKVSVTQFSYLGKSQGSDGAKLEPADFEAIFDAALANPAWSLTARAGIEAAYREYYESVRQDPEAALVHARAATKAWPQQWSYQMQLARLLLKLGRRGEALAVLDAAAAVAGNEVQRAETAQVRAGITP